MEFAGKLKDKVAVVAGTTRGAGRGIAWRSWRHGLLHRAQPARTALWQSPRNDNE